MSAYYNEIDPYAAQWLRNLIAAGHIADGVVDERSILDVRADDLRDFTQCHFFAGIGVWSHALRLAGWNDDKAVWTGSCPCQPFSAAGKQAGVADERHLWPVWNNLINECRPPVVFGEQVAAAIGHSWLDTLQTDLEAQDYAVGAAVLGAHSVGAPHIRQRLYFVADAELRGRERISEQHTAGILRTMDGAGELRQSVGAHGASTGRLGNNNNTGLEGLGGGYQTESGRHGAVRPVAEAGEFGGLEHKHSGGRREGGVVGSVPEILGGRANEREPLAERGVCGVLADASASGRREECSDAGRIAVGDPAQGWSAGFVDGGSDYRPGQTNGFWRDADWLGCRDGKWRPVEPGTFPLAHGATARVGRLRAYGNAICAETAKEFIAAFMECKP